MATSTPSSEVPLISQCRQHHAIVPLHALLDRPATTIQLVPNTDIYMPHARARQPVPPWFRNSLQLQ
jgi:hypothetical protein